VLLVNGGSAVRPNLKVAGTSTAFAAEAAYASMLRDALGGDQIHVGQLIIPGAIQPGHPTHDPAVLADRLWSMHTGKGEFRVFADRMPTDPRPSSDHRHRGGGLSGPSLCRAAAA
jgi:hypothetical protein